MGKKKDKKGKGAERTQLKELKNSEKRLKKELNQLGEEAIEKVISQHNAGNKNITKTSEIKCDPPSSRCNMSFNAHYEKDFLIMFGGEFFNGKETFLYNDLFIYHIKSKEWSQIIAPNSPVPRSSHQAVMMAQGGGQLWIFGGEYTNSSQTQFFHFNDLWVFHFAEKQWEKIDAPGGPSPRSGHRMVSCKKMLFIFGGFCDNSISFKYFNDVHAFSVESRVWLKLQISGVPPSPRSGCVMAVTQDQCNIMVYGGYSKEKVKKDVDKGHTHGDMFMLSVNISKGKCDVDSQPLAWKWSTVKQYGHLPSLRCSSSLVVTSNNRAILFGGIRDEDEDEESVEGCCLNDMYLLEVDKGRWHPLVMRMPNENITKKRRRGIKDVKESESEDEAAISHLDFNVKRLRVLQGTSQEPEDEICHGGDEVFKVIVKTTGQEVVQPTEANETSQVSIFTPSPRMRPMMAAKRSLLYLYGGAYEDGNRQIVLSDFYSIDLQKMSEWNVLIPQKEISMDWEESEDEENSNSDDDEESDEEDSSDDDDDDDEEDDDPTRSGPRKKSDETFKEYFDRTYPAWKNKALKVAEKESIKATPKQVDRAASKMAQEYWDKITFSKKE